MTDRRRSFNSTHSSAASKTLQQIRVRCESARGELVVILTNLIKLWKRAFCIRRDNVGYEKHFANRWPGLLALAALVASVALLGPGQPPPAHANETGIWAHCTRGWDNRIFQPRTRPTEGENYSVAVRTDNGGDGLMRGHWHTVPGSANTSDYEDVQGVYGEGRGVVSAEFATKNDKYPERQEQFTIRFVNAVSGGKSPQCTITITDNDQGVHDVRITSSPADGETYRLGETIEIALDYNLRIKVEGKPLLDLRLGEGSSWRGAQFHGIPWPYDTAYFRYQVQPEDVDGNGISLDGGYVANGEAHGFGGEGQILPQQGDVVGPVTGEIYIRGPRISPWWHGLGDQPGHKVDGRTYATATEIVSIAANGVTYRAGETIDIALTYNNPVEVEGNVLVNLRMGTGSWWRGAAYSRGSGTDTLVFSYTVQPGDLDTDGVSLDGSYVDAQGVPQGYGGDGAMKVAGTDVPVHHYYPALSHHSYHKVDGVKPTISSAAVAADGSTVTVTFTENIQVAPLVRWFIENEGLTEGISEFINAVLNVEVNNAWPIPTAATVSGNTVTVTLPTPISSGEAVQVRYDGVFANDAPGVLVDNAGNPMTNFGATATTNNSTVTTPSGAGNVLLNVRQLAVTEGASSAYTVKLGSKPKGDVTVTITSNAPPNVTISDSSLTFTPDNWDTPQTVTVSSTADDNTYGYWVGITHTASGSGFTGQDTLKVLMQE